MTNDIQIYKDNIKDGILNKFKEINAKENDVLPPRWVKLHFFPSLNPKEKDVFNDAVKELIKEGIIVVLKNNNGNFDNFKLTKKGLDKIYSVATIKCPNCKNEVDSTIVYCSNCGSKLVSDSYPKSIKRKYFAIITFFITIIPGIIGFIQFFSVTELPVIQGEFDLTDQSNKGKQLNFVNDIAKNAGKIIYFDRVSILIGDDEHREENETDATVTYRFNFNELSAPEVKSNQKISESEFVDKLLQYYSIPSEDRKEIETMHLFDMSGYNAHIVIHTKTNDRNEYSDFHPFAAEGTMDFLDGPFQIKDISVAEAVMFELTAPLLDSDEKKQVECTKKIWHWLVKKCLCQFL